MKTVKIGRKRFGNNEQLLNDTKKIESIKFMPIIEETREDDMKRETEC